MSTTDTSSTRTITDKLLEFLRRYYEEDVAQLAQRYPNDQRSLEIDWGDLYRYDTVLAHDFIDQPDALLDYFEEALGKYDLPVDMDLSEATVRVTGIDDTRTYSVGEYRSEQVGSYLAVSGQVSKTSPVRPKPTAIAYECQRCGSTTTVPQHGTETREPSECKGCERQGPFRFDKDATEFVDHQLLRIQQPPEEAQGGRGEYVDAHVEGDLVGEVQPGDRVDLAGTLDLEEPTEGMTFVPYVRGRAADVEETDFEEVAVDEHEERVRALAAGEEGDPYELLMASLAPKIQGYEHIKEAITLQLFGGVQATDPMGNHERGDFHVLLLGDPGTAKSSFLRYVEELAPRSAIVSGKGASKAGVTAAAVRDDFGQEQWSLEAGALVIANKGIACVDEIDKVDEETVSSMHDALEGQRVAVNKAGINATLPAETAVLAAGNPKYGRFDQYEPVGEQIDLPPALMSRFDLMFMVSDQPNADVDRDVADHMIETRQLANKYTHKEHTLSEDERTTIEAPVEPDVFRAWIALAKQTTYPRIEDDAVHEKIREDFLGIRLLNGENNDHPVPVTMRKLEAVQRLAEASARVRLSETIEVEDVERAQRLIGRSLRDVGYDPESEEMDADVYEAGTSQSQRDRRKVFLGVVEELAREYDSGAPVAEVIETMVEEGFNASKVEQDIAHFKDQGDIYHVDGQEKYLRRI